MTEHEQLKEICDTIGYDIDYDFYSIDESFNVIIYKGCLDEFYTLQKINVREIIFTKEFMSKVNKYISDKIMEGVSAYKIPNNDSMGEILNYLDNPVQYLHNLLFNK